MSYSRGRWNDVLLLSANSSLLEKVQCLLHSLCWSVRAISYSWLVWHISIWHRLFCGDCYSREVSNLAIGTNRHRKLIRFLESRDFYSDRHSKTNTKKGIISVSVTFQSNQETKYSDFFPGKLKLLTLVLVKLVFCPGSICLWPCL
jgi:hypothetical protein